MTAPPLASLLIVDDEIAQMTALCRTLEPEGYRTTGATSPHEALEALRHETFDLVLTDLMMAGMDGITLLKHAFEIDPHLVGIVMTGHGTVNTAVEALKAGALDYIVKPFNLSAIKPVLTRALTLRRLRLENTHLRETLGMYELSLAMAFARDADSIVRELADAAYRQSGQGTVSILRAVGDVQRFDVVATRGPRAEMHAGERVAIETPLAPWIARSRDQLNRVDELPDVAAAFAAPAPEIAADAALPMLSAGRLVGILGITPGDGHPTITHGQIKALNVLASTAASALERQRLEEHLRQSQKMEAIGRLTAGVAHDFNNLLTVINGYAEMTLKEPSAAEVRAPILEVKRAGEQAAALTQQLLAFGRKQVTLPAVLDLNTVVERQAGILRRILGEDVRLAIDLDPALGLVRADRGQLEQVLMNLAVNARDAMPEGGTLVIETRTVASSPTDGEAAEVPHTAVSLVVRDTGCGMDHATRTRIFEPFFSTKTIGRGTGLGLSVVHGIVMQHDGSIAVETAPGQGTTFRIHLPVVACPLPLADTATQTDRPTGGTETILVVEDDATVRQVMATMLEHAGYRVVRARHGSEAVELHRREAGRIRLVITDLVMPQMSGPALVDVLLPRDPALRVIYVSGYADDALVGRGQPDPGIPLLQKPFSGGELLRTVRGALDAAARRPDTHSRVFGA